MSFQPKGSISRVTKSRIRRTASPFATTKRKKPSLTQQRSLEKSFSLDEDDQLPDAGLEDIKAIRIRLAPSLSSVSVVSIMRYALDHMFMPVPDRASGMNSVRTAEVLNFRLFLPRVVSTAHIHGLRGSPTATDREIAQLIREGEIRKVTVPNRGKGSITVGDALIFVLDWIKLVEANDELEASHKQKYIALLRGDDQVSFTPDENKELSKHGLLTASSTLPTMSSTFLKPASSSLGSLNYVAGAGANNASGSTAAVASSSIQHIHGGTRPNLNDGSTNSFSSYKLALPNMGPYLKLMSEAREHILHILRKSGPFKSLAYESLKERWEGGFGGAASANRASLFASTQRQGQLLPGRTKKWKDFYGLQFEHVLAECIGAGLVECFKSAGTTGIRAS